MTRYRYMVIYTDEGVWTLRKEKWTLWWPFWRQDVVEESCPPGHNETRNRP